MNHHRAATIKVIVVGNGRVGKSSMTTRYCKNVFTDTYKKTIGTWIARLGDLLGTDRFGLPVCVAVRWVLLPCWELWLRRRLHGEDH